jgi:uncharacterized membrane protein YgdD (TMEM256/DUF423 family)
LAAHASPGPTLDTAARFLLFHAPALAGIVALVASGAISAPVGRAAGCLLAAGLALFSGDLALRALAGVAVIASVAPTGGVLLMLGWLLLAASSVMRPRS